MNLLRAELFKLRSTSLWWIMLIILVPLWALSMGGNWLFLHGGDKPSAAEAFANLYTTGQYFGVLLVMLLGALLVTNEFFHLMATTTFLVTPQRERVIYAKFLAMTIIAFGTWLLLTVLDLIVAPLILKQENYASGFDSGATWRAIGLNLLAFLAWAVLGVGFGVLIRSQIGATLTLSIVYVLGTTIVSVIFQLLADHVAKWIGDLQVLVPTVASQLMVAGGDLPGHPARWVGGVILVGYALVAGVIGTVLTKSRDIA